MYIIVQYTICACRTDNIGCGTQSSILYVGYSLACIHVCVVCTMQYVYCSTYVRCSMQYVRTICCVTCIMQYSMYTIAQYTIYCMQNVQSIQYVWYIVHSNMQYVVQHIISCTLCVVYSIQQHVVCRGIIGGSYGGYRAFPLYS